MSKGWSSGKVIIERCGLVVMYLRLDSFCFSHPFRSFSVGSQVTDTRMGRILYPIKYIPVKEDQILLCGFGESGWPRRRGCTSRSHAERDVSKISTRACCGFSWEAGRLDPRYGPSPGDLVFNTDCTECGRVKKRDWFRDH